MQHKVKIAISDFVKRQTPESKYSHTTLSWDELLEEIQKRFDFARTGYRDGVVLVNLNPKFFFTSVVPVVENEKYSFVFKARQEGEAPFLQSDVYGQKVRAKYVDVVLYRSDVLSENNENTSDADWEVVSINASPTDGPVPMTPMTMARNQLRLVGGTLGRYSPEEWAESVNFWSKHVMVTPVKSRE